MSKKSIEFKKTASVEEIARFFEDLTNSFRSGVVCVQRGGEYVTLRPAPAVEIEVEARQKRDKERMSIEIEWKAGDAGGEGAGDFKISSSGPAAA